MWEHVFEFALRKRALFRPGLAIITAVVLLCSLTPGALAADRKSSPQEPKYEMGTFYVCLLVKGAKYNAAETPQNASWGPGHIKHMTGLVDSGRVVIAGPFIDDARIRGLWVMTATSVEDAQSWAEADPGVKAGHFAVEILKWFAAKNVIKKPDMPLTPVTYYFAFLKRGPNWTAADTPEKQALQNAHMAHIQSMAATGKLVIAGPLTGVAAYPTSAPYAGVFVFKVGTFEEAKSLAEADPTVKAGRLIAEVHPWWIPKGSLP